MSDKTERQELVGKVRLHLIQMVQIAITLFAFWEDHTNSEKLRKLEQMAIELEASIMMMKARFHYDNGGEEKVNEPEI